ncbi:FAD dependent oxidoreductase [Phlyctema vagabunda]|uniref:FAD dependent oxidoreductase n=1 Tax=Phlyctema vagabunda TaxID=108571 RepID=A0ABR4P2J7_9HELO
MQLRSLLRNPRSNIRMASSTTSEKKNIVIIGGGIIGCTTAYYLTRHPSFSPANHSVTILEAQSIASGASGKAGGLLALWAYPSCIVPLSYKLHAELAKEHGGEQRWGYRAVHCGSLSANGKVHTPRLADGGADENGNKEEWQKLPKLEGKNQKIARGLPKDLDWFDEEGVTSYSKMGDPTTTAQVQPYQFTTSMADLATEAGAKVILGSVTNIDYASGVKSVTYTDKTSSESHTIPATDIVLAAGPWTSHIFPSAPIEAMRAHSVCIKADVSPYAIFSEIDLPRNFTGSSKTKRRHGKTVSPEMYARPNGEVYACGEGDSLVPLPKSSDLVECDESRCQDIIDYVASISTPLREGEVLVKQACYLPSVSTGGGPLIGHTGIKGLFLAAGHTCWGIQNSCATGKLMSEFIFDGKAKSANVGSLDPRAVL